jgi:hypothetical protein
MVSPKLAFLMVEGVLRVLKTTTVGLQRAPNKLHSIDALGPWTVN